MGYQTAQPLDDTSNAAYAVEGAVAESSLRAPLLPPYFYDPSRPRASLARLGLVTGAIVLVVVLIATLAIRAPGGGGASTPVTQIGVTLGLDPNTQVTVSWAVPLSSGAGAVASARVRFGLVKSGAALPFSAPGSCVSYSTTPEETFNHSSYTSPLLCTAYISTPPSTAGMSVAYSVGDDVNGFSSVRTTATAPPPGVAGVRFAFMGDLGTTADSAATLAAIGASHVAAPFAAAFLVGDLSYADSEERVWDTFGESVDPLVSALPLYTLPGNHEWFDTSVQPCDYKSPNRTLLCNYTFTSYIARSRSPSAGGVASADALYYSVNVGLVHFIMLQGYCTAMKTISEQPCLAPGSPQALWLVGDLARVDRSKTPWVVVAFHQPWVNSNEAHPIALEGRPIQDAIEAVLYAGGVDLVFSGHTHAYERSCRIFNYTCLTDGTGPVFITIGDGGNREGPALNWTQPQPAWSLYRQASFGHGELTAVNATALRWVWVQNPALTPTMLDEHWLIKGSPGQAGGSGVSPIPQRRARVRRRV